MVEAFFILVEERKSNNRFLTSPSTSVNLFSFFLHERQSMQMFNFMHYIPWCPLTGYSDGAAGYLGAVAGNGFGNTTPTQVQPLSLQSVQT